MTEKHDQQLLLSVIEVGWDIIKAYEREVFVQNTFSNYVMLFILYKEDGIWCSQQFSARVGVTYTQSHLINIKQEIEAR